MIEDGTPLADLREAVQRFAQSTSTRACLVDVAVLLWEQTSMDDQGVVGRAIHYCIPTDNFGLAAALGLLQAGGYYMTEDLFGEPDA